MKQVTIRFIIGATLALVSASTLGAAPSEPPSREIVATTSAPVHVAAEGTEGCTQACYEMRNEQGQFTGYACITGSSGYNCSAQQYTCGFNIPEGGCPTNPGGDAEITISLADGRVIEMAQYCQVARRITYQQRVGFLTARQWNALEFRDRSSQLGVQ